MPDDASKASGDRVQIPGARESGALLPTVLHADVPNQETHGQASVNQLHFSVVQVPGARSENVSKASLVNPWLTQYRGGTTCSSATRENT